jgi:hypothetical protein
MANVKDSIEAEAATPQQAFSVVSDLGAADWLQDLLGKPQLVEGTGPGVGARYQVVFSGSTHTLRVTRLEPPRLVEMVVDGGSPQVTIRFNISPTGTGSRVEVEADFKSGLGPIVDSIAARKVRNEYLPKVLRALQDRLRRPISPAANLPGA